MPNNCPRCRMPGCDGTCPPDYDRPGQPGGMFSGPVTESRGAASVTLDTIIANGWRTERCRRKHFTSAQDIEHEMSKWGWTHEPSTKARYERRLAKHIAWLEKHGMPSDEWLRLSGFDSYVSEPSS